MVDGYRLVRVSAILGRGTWRCLLKKLSRITIESSAQEEIRRLASDRDPRHPDAASSISAGLSIVGKIVGHGSVTVASYGPRSL